MPKPIIKKWTEPKLSIKGQTWFVWFRFYDVPTKSWKLIKRKAGVNYRDPKNPEKFLLSKADRIKHLKRAQKSLLDKLEYEHWNPITNINELQDDEPDLLKKQSFRDALSFAMSKKGNDWKKKTKQDYASVVKYILNGAANIGMADKLIKDFRLVHFKLIMESTQSIRKLSAKGYNKYREYLSSLVGELIQWEIVELNYVHHVASKKTVKTFAHRPPTPAQKTTIVKHIRENHPAFYRFIATLYACTIREKELLALRISDLKREEHIFRIIPDHDQENSKTNIEREVIIPDSLMSILDEMNLHTFPADFHIFSRGYLPGPAKVHSNTPTVKWKKIVKDPKNGLGINVDLYSLKKAGGNDMVKLQRMHGASQLLDLPRSQMGHTTDGMTEVYVTEHLEVQKEIFRKNMPLL